MKKKIWRKNFEIVRTHMLMASPALFDMMKFQPTTVNKLILKEIVWIQKGLDNTGTYMPLSQLRSFIDEIIKVILTQPKRIKNIHKKAIELNIEFFNFSKKLLKVNFKKLNNNELAKLYDKLANLEIKSHGYALPTTWFVDCDGEDFSKLLLAMTKEIISKSSLKLNVAETFSKLTTPAKLSLTAQEELASLKVVKSIKEDPKARKIFLQKNISKIGKDLTKLNKPLYRKVINHYRKWQWTPYTYIGPSYDLDYYLEIWSGLLKQKVNIEKEISRLAEYDKVTRQEKNKLISKLKIDNKTKQNFDIAAEIIYLKAFRKDCWYFGHFVKDKFLQEVARRLNLSLNQVWFMGWWELSKALRKGSFSAKTLNQRMKYCILHQKGLSAKIYTGKQAKNFLKTLELEEKRIKKVNNFKGTCAYGGKTKGIVKVVNIPKEMSKMNKGDIMVSHTTFPALVPAIKKAAALITDDGGITCHAAIVAREMKIPCVIGTKIATKVLKDGDKVEVDASKGIIKKVK